MRWAAFKEHLPLGGCGGARKSLHRQRTLPQQQQASILRFCCRPREGVEELLDCLTEI